MKNIYTFLFLTIGSLVMAQESYVLSDTSTMTIDGSSSLHDWTVTANTMEGKIAADGEILKTVEFSAMVSDILSDRAAAMDNKMHEALKKEEYPKITFHVDNAEMAIGESQVLEGTLMIAGVEKQVNVTAAISQEDGSISVKGEQPIALKDFEIEPPTAMFGSIVVGDNVTVKFDLVFKKS